jgi:Tol biopolymer transport system component
MKPNLVPLLRPAAFVFALLALAAGAPDPTADRVSVSTAGDEADQSCQFSALSATARWAAFVSSASNLVEGDANGTYDIFLRDREHGTTTRVSVGLDGVDANENSQAPALTPSGRLVGFYSFASNLVAGDTNDHGDVFVRDLKTGVTELISVRADGGLADDNSFDPVFAGSGRYVAFWSLSALASQGESGAGDIYVRDRKLGQTQLVSVSSEGLVGNLRSEAPSISANGRWVAFQSQSTNLVEGDDNAKTDIFLRDCKQGTTTRISVNDVGVQGNGDSEAPAISANGRWVAFSSKASNLVDGDTNGVADVFVRDLVHGQTRRVSVSTEGVEGTGEARRPCISGNGRWIGFDTGSALVADDLNDRYDVYLHDRLGGETWRVSTDALGGDADNDSTNAVVTRSGRWASFTSPASNIVAGDTNDLSDVFVRRAK